MPFFKQLLKSIASFGLMAFWIWGFSALSLQGQTSGKTFSPNPNEDFIEKASAVFLENIDSSIYYFQQGLDWYRQQEKWLNYVKCLNGLSSCYYYLGDYPNSLVYMEKAKNAAEEKIGKNNDAYTSVLNNLAHIHSEKGEFDKALEKYFQALDTEKKMNNDKEVVTILNNIGLCFYKKGDIDEGLQYYTRALQSTIDLYGPKDLRVADSYITIAKIFQFKNESDTALVLHQKAIDILQRPDTPQGKITIDRLIGAHQEMARIFASGNDVRRLKDHLQQAHQLSQQHFGQPASVAYTILGQWQSQQGFYNEADKNLSLALENYKKKYQSFDRHPTIGKAHTFLAQNHFFRQEYSKSLEQYQAALRHFSDNFSDPNVLVNPRFDQLINDQDILEILDGKAQSLFAAYRKNPAAHPAYLDAAHQTYQLTMKMIQQIRQNFLASGSKEQLSEIVIPVYEGALECLLEKDQGQLSAASVEEAFQLFESSKAILLLESINENTAMGYAGIPDSLLEKEQNLKNEIFFYEKKIREEKAKNAQVQAEKMKTMEGKLFELRRVHQQLIGTFEQDYPRYHQLKYDTRLADVQSIQKKLPNEKSALLEYLVGPKNIYAFYISKTESRIMVLPGHPQLEEQIGTFRNLLRIPYPQDPQQSFIQFTSLAHQLYRQLLYPIQIDDAIDQLFITPDDWIAYIPFEVLLSKAAPQSSIDYSFENLSYLLRDYSVSYNYSASLWLQSTPEKQKNLADFIGFAPGFRQDQAANFSSRACDQDQLYQLQCTGEEVRQLGKLFNGKVMIDDAANKSNFTELAKNYRILHLATHSCLDDEDPMENKIFFTDDFISNYDLYHLRLNAELAVLSACNTGNGALLRGEGVMSLSRGFIHAGCPSTLISMWSVEDCTTADLMQMYYRGLKGGLSKEKALRKAKLQYLASADKLHSHPFYWAPFVQFGETKALDLNDGISLSWKWILLLLGMGAFGLLFLQKTKSPA